MRCNVAGNVDPDPGAVNGYVASGVRMCTRMVGGRAPRVFVSYAHDDEEHRRLVLGLCTFLRGRGVDVRVDRWAVGQRQDWYLWAIEQILAADFVLVVASPACREAGDGVLAAQRHRGVQTELSLLRDRQHADRRVWQRKILPVVLPGRDVNDIPLFLQPYCADHYLVTGFTDAGARDLLVALGRTS